MKVTNWKKTLTYAVTTMSVIMTTSCSSMSPEAQESWESLRGALPKALRGDAIPLEEYPRPSLQGSWVDDGFPMLKIRFVQSGNNLTVYRDGERYDIVVRERIKATLTGRAINAKYINDPPDDIRPTSGNCSGSVSKDSQRVKFTCTYRGELLALNFSKTS